MPISDQMQKQMDKRDAKVLVAIKSRKLGIGFADLKKKLGLANNALRGALRRLRARKSIRKLGISRDAVYAA